MSREAEVTITSTFYFRITRRLSSCDCDARSRTPARSLIKRIVVHRRIVRSEAESAAEERIAPPSLPLDYPPSVADMLAGLGLTHDIIAARVGISRQQVTNVIHGRFGISRPVAQRVLELARAA
jgi:hypothetical protein